EMVPLERLEEELHDALDTSDRVCGVTCVPDEARGERLAVLYVPPLLAQHNVDVRGWSERLGGRGLPNLWLPSERDFLPVPEIPVLGRGKVGLKRVKDLGLELARKGRGGWAMGPRPGVWLQLASAAAGAVIALFLVAAPRYIPAAPPGEGVADVAAPPEAPVW